MKISIFHEFHKPPFGGGNQFLLALKREFENQGIKVLENKLDKDTTAVLFNSFNFDFSNLQRQRRVFPDIKFIHRVDGPIGLYRGEGPEIDEKIAHMNNSIADTTVFQSKFSLSAMKQLGLKFSNTHVITNAADPNIFYATGIRETSKGKIRIMASSWSNNLNKGGPLYAELEKLLDWNQFELTFVGRTQMEFSKIKVIPPLDSIKLAEELRRHDLYLTASMNDPCSNSLIEALSCGLPAAYLNSGGHPEIVGKAGVPFKDAITAVKAIEKIAKNREQFVKEIRRPSISEVAKEYLALMR